MKLHTQADYKDALRDIIELAKEKHTAGSPKGKLLAELRYAVKWYEESTVPDPVDMTPINLNEEFRDRGPHDHVGLKDPAPVLLGAEDPPLPMLEERPEPVSVSTGMENELRAMAPEFPAPATDNTPEEKEAFAKYRTKVSELDGLKVLHLEDMGVKLYAILTACQHLDTLKYSKAHRGNANDQLLMTRNMSVLVDSAVSVIRHHMPKLVPLTLGLSHYIKELEDTVESLRKELKS